MVAMLFRYYLARSVGHPSFPPARPLRKVLQPVEMTDTGDIHGNIKEMSCVLTVMLELLYWLTSASGAMILRQVREAKRSWKTWRATTGLFAMIPSSLVRFVRFT